jgi:hypothetical protein
MASLREVRRAISVRQSLVEQILRCQKKFVYRSIRRNIRDGVNLYISAKPFDDSRAWLRIKKQPGDLPTGVIVGTVEITLCAR